MKKIIILLFSVTLLMQSCTFAKAESEKEIPVQKEDILCESADFEGVKKLEDEMLNGLKDMCDWLEDSSHFPEEMDFSKGVKIYVNTGIQNFGTDQESEIMKNLEQSKYVWVIPMKIGGEYVSVTAAKGNPLNEERAAMLTAQEREEIEKQEGKWTVSEWATGVAEPYLSQIQNNKEIMEACDHTVLIGGVPGLHEPAVLGFKDGKALGWMSLGFGYPVLEEIPTARSVSNGLYDFHAVMEASQEYANSINNASRRRLHCRERATDKHLHCCRAGSSDCGFCVDYCCEGKKKRVNFLFSCRKGSCINIIYLFTYY